MITIVDYGVGDHGPLARAFGEVGAEARIASSIDALDRSSHLVVSGSGSFEAMIRGLRNRKQIPSVMRAILEGRRYLGIGLGMQLLLDVTYEDGQHTGLGVVPGKVVPLDGHSTHPVQRNFKPPHQGWASVQWAGNCPLLTGLKSGEQFYFEHGSRAQPLDSEFTFARTRYGVDISAVMWNGKLFGTQFMPELSAEAGRKVLRNFATA